MNDIVPAIMPKNFQDIADQVTLVKEICSVVQLDIMDGQFVPAKTWPYRGSFGDQNLQSFDLSTGLPFWQEIDYELDLMIQSPELSWDRWVAWAPRRIVVHVESLSQSELLKKKMHEVKEYIECGIALDQQTSVDTIEPFIDMVSYVQCMGIQKIGVQGAHFSSSVLNQIISIKTRYPHLLIQVDGSVNRETLGSLRATGADRFVVGSAIFQADDVTESVFALQNM